MNRQEAYDNSDGQKIQEENKLALEIERGIIAYIKWNLLLKK